MISATQVEPATQPQGVKICAHLAEHGIGATGTVVADQAAVGVGGLILARALEQRADLIVMGAYGRSRVREALLGGTSDQVLTEAKILTLMSH